VFVDGAVFMCNYRWAQVTGRSRELRRPHATCCSDGSADGPAIATFMYSAALRTRLQSVTLFCACATASACRPRAP
jgi:hypothetical protein